VSTSIKECCVALELTIDGFFFALKDEGFNLVGIHRPDEYKTPPEFPKRFILSSNSNFDGTLAGERLAQKKIKAVAKRYSLQINYQGIFGYQIPLSLLEG
jgi:hypothetical protein